MSHRVVQCRQGQTDSNPHVCLCPWPWCSMVHRPARPCKFCSTVCVTLNLSCNPPSLLPMCRCWPQAHAISQADAGRQLRPWIRRLHRSVQPPARNARACEPLLPPLTHPYETCQFSWGILSIPPSEARCIELGNRGSKPLAVRCTSAGNMPWVLGLPL